MKVYTRLILDWDGNIVACNSRLHIGSTSYCKGPSQQQKDLAQQQADLAKQQQGFYNTLMQNYSQQFANQNAILNAVKQVYDPILKAGPSQFGFAPQEEAALRTQASEGTAAQYQGASRALAERVAAAGGGNNLLPSGVNAQLSADISGAAAKQESDQQLGITTAGYEVGRQNFANATNAELAASGQINPLGYAGASTGAGGAAQSGFGGAFNSATTIRNMQNASSPLGVIGGIVGGAASSFLNPLANKLGGFLGNLGGNNIVPVDTSGGGISSIYTTPNPDPTAGTGVIGGIPGGFGV